MLTTCVAALRLRIPNRLCGFDAEPRGVPPQRRHGDARRPAGVRRLLLQRAPHERGLPGDQRLLCRRGYCRGETGSLFLLVRISGCVLLWYQQILSSGVRNL